MRFTDHRLICLITPGGGTGLRNGKLSTMKTFGSDANASPSMIRSGTFTIGSSSVVTS